MILISHFLNTTRNMQVQYYHVHDVNHTILSCTIISCTLLR